MKEIFWIFLVFVSAVILAGLFSNRELKQERRPGLREVFLASILSGIVSAILIAALTDSHPHVPMLPVILIFGAIAAVVAILPASITVAQLKRRHGLPATPSQSYQPLQKK